jgi:hypothetical protein
LLLHVRSRLGGDRQHLYRVKYQQADPDALDEEATAA